jgi:glycosyltransferase involved in cell wall biosynthesis
VRITIVHPFLFKLARGIERYVVSLSGAFASHGIHVDVLTWKWQTEVEWAEIHPGVRFIKMPYVRYLAEKVAIVFYLLWLAFHRSDMIVVFFAGYGEALALRLLGLIRRQQYCIVFHFPVEQVPHRYKEFARYGFVQKASILVAVSEHTATGVRRLFRRPCHVIHNGTDPKVFAPTPGQRAIGRKLLDRPEASPVIVTVAALEERKGIQYLIHALPGLVREFPEIIYTVVGEGPYRGNLEALAAELEVLPHVRFIGASSEVVTYLAAGDIGCLLSTGEASPVALFEYMSMGLPCITSSEVPFPEIVSPEYGIMVDEKEPMEVQNTIARLLRDRDLRVKMGKAARQAVIRCHTWAMVAETYERIFTKDPSDQSV